MFSSAFVAGGQKSDVRDVGDGQSYEAQLPLGLLPLP